MLIASTGKYVFTYLEWGESASPEGAAVSQRGRNTLV